MFCPSRSTVFWGGGGGCGPATSPASDTTMSIDLFRVRSETERRVDGGGRRLTVVLDGGSDADALELAELTGQLRRQLLELDVDTVELARSAEVPEGAKPLDAVSIGALVVTAGPGLLKTVVGLVGKWLARRPVRCAKLTIDGDSIELSDATAAEQQQLIAAFVDRHSRP
jgi:hypothetical protein